MQILAGACVVGEIESKRSAYPIGALDGERKADEEDDAWSCHARTTKRSERPQPSVPHVPMHTNL